jgi:hypothetical protein
MILDELRKVASGLQGKCAPVPWGIEGMGELGYMTRERGLYVNPAYRRPLDLALRESVEYERTAREVSHGRYGAEVLAPIARRISDHADVIRTMKRMRGALTSWDQIVTAMNAGKSAQVSFLKASNALASNAWQCEFAIAGMPTAGSFGAIPGGSAFTGSSVGSMVSPGTANIGGSDHCYLTNVSLHALANVLHNQIFGVVDLLVGAGSIAAATGTSQDISTTALPRWTTGEGLCMSLVVTTNLVGGTAPTIAITYTDQAGNTANSTGAITVTTAATAGRMLPVQDGPMIRLASPDTGVRQIEACIITGTITSGVLAGIIYKPIMFMGVLANQSVERTTPSQAGGMRRITETAGALPCLTMIRFASNTSNTLLGGFLEFAWG